MVTPAVLLEVSVSVALSATEGKNKCVLWLGNEVAEISIPNVSDTPEVVLTPFRIAGSGVGFSCGCRSTENSQTFWANQSSERMG